MRHDTLRHPDDLHRHRALTLHTARRNGGDYFWTLSNGAHSGDFAIDPVLVANGPSPLKSALLYGEGLMLASEVTFKAEADSGRVRRVLPDWVGPTLDFNAVFLRGRVEAPKVRAFIDFLVNRLSFKADDGQTLAPNRRRIQAAAP